MRGRRSVILATLAVGSLAAAALLLGGRVGAEASVLSRGARGWLAARLYLEGRGARVALVDRPLEPLASGGVLVLAFPWQRVRFGDEELALQDHLRRGGTLVLAFSGARFDHPTERRVLEAVGLRARDVREDPPLSPLLWRRYAAAEWRLRPDPGLTGEPGPVLISAPRRVPTAPPAARVLYRGEDDVPVIFVHQRGRGRVVVLPAEALANARIGTAGNADLLETMLSSFGREWAFDEFHHGLAAPASPSEASNRRVMDAWLLHVAFVYLLWITATARRFGPAWSEPPVIAGSVGAFLLGLAALHHRLGHHAEAARLLLVRAAELEPRLSLPAGMAARAAEAGADDFLLLAREVGRRQAQGRSEA